MNEIYKKFTAVNFIFSFCLALVASLIAPYLQTRGFSASQISLMFAVFPFTIILFIPFFGKLADTISRSLIIWIGIWFEIIALVLYLIDGNWGVVILARFFDAIAASLVVIIVIAKIVDGDEKTRGKDTGLSLSFGAFGGLIGPFVGALLADKIFIQFPFIIAIIILFILSLFLFSEKFKKRIKGFGGKISKFNWFSEIKLFLSNRQLKGMGIMGMVMHGTNPVFSVALPLLIINKMGLSYTSIGIVMFLHVVPQALQTLYGKWADKRGYWKGVVLGTMIVAVFLIPIFFIYKFWLLVLVLFLMGIGTGLWNVSAWSLMSDIGEKMKVECQILTSYFSIAKVGELISFFLVSLLVKFIGLQIVFLLIGISIIIGNIFAFNYLKPRPKGINN